MTVTIILAKAPIDLIFLLPPAKARGILNEGSKQKVGD